MERLGAPYKLRELAEALKSAFSKAFTVKYPYEPSPAPEAFRGKLQLDVEKCIGCGACVEGCPTGALTLEDEEEKRRITLSYPYCISCGQCVERCPVDAINFTTEYSVVSTRREDLLFQLEKDLVRCEVCGAPVATVDHLKWVMANLGFLTLSNSTLLVAAYEISTGRLPKKPSEPKETIERQDLLKILCARCRRKAVALDHGWRAKY
ncbi:MAG: 4Fe-4S dicluster domain-containing protein [Candidatus Hecatellaceae archaeon]